MVERNCWHRRAFSNGEAMSRDELRSPRHEALRKFLKLERQRSELTQGQLAERLGWDQRTISNIETGSKRVTFLEVIELAEVLGFDGAATFRRIAKIRD
jgi:transcriptional regulator with XRE-family HTH domain